MGSEKSHGSLMNARQTGVVMSARPVDLRRTSGRPVAPLLRERLDSREDIDIIWRAPARIVRGAGGGGTESAAGLRSASGRELSQRGR
jgi:hypothetical protein